MKRILYQNAWISMWNTRRPVLVFLRFNWCWLRIRNRDENFTNSGLAWSYVTLVGHRMIGLENRAQVGRRGRNSVMAKMYIGDTTENASFYSKLNKKSVYCFRNLQLPLRPRNVLWQHCWGSFEYKRVTRPWRCYRNRQNQRELTNSKQRTGRLGATVPMRSPIDWATRHVRMVTARYWV